MRATLAFNGLKQIADKVIGKVKKWDVGES